MLLLLLLLRLLLPPACRNMHAQQLTPKLFFLLTSRTACKTRQKQQQHLQL
jgi:hypothetical protein